MKRYLTSLFTSLFLLGMIGCPDETGVATGNAQDSGNTIQFEQTNETPTDAGTTVTIQDSGAITQPPMVTDAGSEAEPPPAPSCTCPEGYNVTPGQDACSKTLTELAINEGVSYEVCDAVPNFNYGKFGARYPDGTKIQSDYWGRDDGPSNIEGRQNEVGIWACDSDGEAGYQPSGEWIGFAHCLELDSKSDYMVGIAGDNRVRLKLNGEVVFEDVSNNTSAFNYWWISALNVRSGLNIIEMQGYNVSGPASFGAEISGPFPPDSLNSDEAMIDADYANRIVFSTGVLVGQNFDVGEDSGWTCPENYSLNRCTEEPVCTYIDVIPCLGTDGGL